MPNFTVKPLYTDVEAQRQTLTGNVGNVEAFGSEFSSGIVRGFLGIGGGLVGTAEWLIPGKQESLLEAKEKIEASGEKFAPEYDNWSGWAGRVIGETLPYMGTALAGGYAGVGIAGGIAGIGTGGLTGQAAIGVGLGVSGAKAAGALLGAASIGFAIEGQAAYDNAIESGASEDEANAERLIVGTINAAIEAAQITKLMKFHKTGAVSLKSFIRNVRDGVWDLVKGDAKKFSGQILRTALEEGLEEAAQEGVSISVPGFLRGDIQRKPDGSVDWNYVLNRVGGAFAGGAFAGGVLGGAGALVGASSEISRPSNSDIDATLSRIEKMDIPKQEKDLWRAKLNELKQEQNKEDIAKEDTTQPESEHVALSRNWDEQLVRAVDDIDTSLREEHIQQIKKRKGERINVAKEILSNPDENPRTQFIAARSVLADELGLRFDPVKFDENQVNYYYQRIKTSPDLTTFERLQAESGLNALFGFHKDSKGMAKLPEPNQIKQLEKVFGPRLTESLMKLRGETRKVSNKVIEALNLPRAVLASFDVSAGGRQGLLLLPIAPKQWAKAVGRGYKAWTSPEYADYVDIQIKSDPYYKKFRNSGGFLSQVGGITRGEEVFASKWAKAIPGIKASERAYTTTLNSLRFYTFKKYAQKWQGSGKTAEDYEKLAKFINHATGRGDIKGLEEYAPFLNATFFAPRLQMGRIQSITDLFKGIKGDLKKGEISPTRKIIAADLVSFFGGGIGILALLSKMKGISVEDDPRSSDFGKIRFGNTRIDFWGGYSQIARLVAQLATAEMKGTDTDRVMKVDRGNIIWRFIQTKLSPAAGLSVDLVRGETFLGKQLEATPEIVSEQVYERFTPLFVQDVVDALRYQGFTSAAIVSPLAVHGIGAMTYPVRPSSEAAKMKDSLSREKFGKSWDEISNIGQQYIRESNPEIELMERKASVERENFDLVAKRLEEQRKVMNGIIDKMPSPIRKDIDNLNVYIPGLSRYVANGFYLNDNRYKEYQNKVKVNMTLYLSQLKNLDVWNLAPDSMKAGLIEEVINAIKKQTRDDILKKITFEDLQQLT